MKRSSLVLASVLLLTIVSVAGAQQPAETEMATSSVTNIDAGPDGTCWASTTCWDGSVVQCAGSDTCTSVDSNCPNLRGYVKCDGVYTWCPWCPACSREDDDCYSDLDCRAPHEAACEHCICGLMSFDPEAPGPGQGICVCP